MRGESHREGTLRVQYALQFELCEICEVKSAQSYPMINIYQPDECPTGSGVDFLSMFHLRGRGGLGGGRGRGRSPHSRGMHKEIRLSAIAEAAAQRARDHKSIKVAEHAAHQAKEDERFESDLLDAVMQLSTEDSVSVDSVNVTGTSLYEVVAVPVEECKA